MAAACESVHLLVTGPGDSDSGGLSGCQAPSLSHDKWPISLGKDVR